MDSFSNSRPAHRFDWGALIGGVLMIIVALLLLRHPAKGLHAFVLLFGFLSIVQGFVWLAGYSRFHLYFSRSWVTLISGILDILIGILFLGSYEIGGLTLAYLFAVWFFVDSVVGIVFAWHLRDFGTASFIFYIILNIISLLLALFLIFHPVFAALSLIWLVAFWLLVFGFNEVVLAFVHR